MKKIILTIGICIVSLMGVQAQTSSKSEPTVEQRVDKKLSTLTSTCNLTADQQAKIKPILTQAITQGMEDREKYGTDKTGLKKAIKELAKDTKTKIYAILTADQQAKLTAYQTAQKAQRGKQSTTGVDQE